MTTRSPPRARETPCHRWRVLGRALIAQHGWSLRDLRDAVTAALRDGALAEWTKEVLPKGTEELSPQLLGEQWLLWRGQVTRLLREPLHNRELRTIAGVVAGRQADCPPGREVALRAQQAGVRRLAEAISFPSPPPNDREMLALYLVARSDAYWRAVGPTPGPRAWDEVVADVGPKLRDYFPDDGGVTEPARLQALVRRYRELWIVWEAVTKHEWF